MSEPRHVITDYLHNMRFHVDALQTDGNDRLVVDGRPQAGFSTCTTPEVTVEAMEYREGQHIYTQKYPGNPSFNDCTLQRGVARQDSAFIDWIRQVIEGSGDYRATVQIKHYHRVSALDQTFPSFGLNAKERLHVFKDDEGIATPSRIYRLYQTWPIRHKVAGDLDATSSDISVMELDLSYEWFDLVENVL